MANSLKKIIPVLVGLSLAITVSAYQVNLNFYIGKKKIHVERVEAGTKYTLSDIMTSAGINMADSVCRGATFYGWQMESAATGDAEPDIVSTVTPIANVNLFAVFERSAAATNRYVRVTSLAGLENNAQYLIVCYYYWGGEHQYYAMCNNGMSGTENNTYTYQYQNYYKINADRRYPKGGVITAPRADMIWTLKEANGGKWKWQNNQNSKWLRVRNNRTYPMLVDTEGDATACDISVANGIFSILNTADGIGLKYVDDEITNYEDFFITGSSNDYVIYLYKKESRYTSFLDCEAWTVHLDAGNGVIGTSTNHKFDSTEVSAGNGIMLPDASLGDGCDGWTFAGWSVDAPVAGQSAAPTGLISAYNPADPSSVYSPLYNGVTLYAVFTKTETVVKYTKVTTLSSGTYLIVAQDGDNYYAMGNTEHLYSTRNYTVAGITITVNASGEIVGDQDDAIEWTYGSYRFQNKGNTSVYVNPYRTSSYGSYIYHVLGIGQNLTIKQSGGKWAIYNSSSTSNNLTYSSGEFQNTYSSSYYYHFYLYKKSSTTTTTYTTFPRCVPFTVTLHAGGGWIWKDGVENSTKVDEDDEEEAAANAGIPLPTAYPSCTKDKWTFHGWFIGEELDAIQDTVFKDIIPAGESYYPTTNNTHLYAVYKKETDIFNIIHDVENIVSGDTYLITYYAEDSSDGKSYDYELCSTANGSFLTGVKGVAPLNGVGYYMQTNDSTVMWNVTGSGNTWQIKSLTPENYYLKGHEASERVDLDGGKYYYRGALEITTTPTSSYIGYCDGWAVTVGYSSSYFISYRTNENIYYSTPKGSYSVSSGTVDGPFCYMWRRVKEYASWPHCDPFVVNFEGVGGTPEVTSRTEIDNTAYKGVLMPDAYVNSDCAAEGWEFAGWATSPIDEATDLLTFDLYAKGMVYHPVADGSTLYAVYQLKTDKFKRITSEARLHTGVNYIIATDGNKALANLPDNSSNPQYVTSKSVVVDGSQIITNDDDSLEWRLEGHVGEYELYNPIRNVYLDLQEPGLALLTKNKAADQFHITYSDAKGYNVRSVQNLANGDGAQKYLGFLSSLFRTVALASTPTLYFYRQQSTYHSNPKCVDDIEAVKWEADGAQRYAVLESYRLNDTPDMHNAIGSPDDSEGDGTFRIEYNTSLLSPCSEATIMWDETELKLKIPYIVASDADASTFLASTDCPSCDMYILPGHTFTVDANTTMRTVTVPDGATLAIDDDVTLTVKTLILASEGDESAPVVNLNARGSIVLKDDRIFHDRRIDEERYYWLTLPYDAELKEVSYANENENGGKPVYRGTTSENRFFVKYYDGALRAADANGGAQDDTYWRHVVAKGQPYTLKAGQGYNVGIGNQKNKQYPGQTYTHTKRVLRFTMRPDKGTWLAQERNAAGSKITTVAPSTCSDRRNYVHAGWNLIGNPYLHNYSNGATGSSGLRNGAWIEEEDEYGDKTGWWILDENQDQDVPYFTIHTYVRNAANNRDSAVYEQVLASGRVLRPFETTFVQINEGNTLNFTSGMNISAAPARRRAIAPDIPVRTGIILSGNNRVDRTGFAISDEYTTHYEIGADLVKYANKGALNLYTFNADNHQLAFNGLSEEDAAQPIAVGVTFPTAGEYTFEFDAEQYSTNEIESLILIDHQEKMRINLKNATYTVTTNAGTVDNRFSIIIRLAKDVTTDIVTVGFEEDQPRKVIRDGHLYILRDDEIYNATGVRVK